MFTALSGDGDTLAVGAMAESGGRRGVDPGNEGDNSAPASGAVYVFTRSGVSWTQQSYLKASNAESYDYFGGPVALSDDGSTLAVGATAEDGSGMGANPDPTDNTATDSGAVYVFTRAGATWSEQAYLKASNPNGGDEFGRAVALSADGRILAVGADFEDGPGTGINSALQDINNTGTAGAVYVFGNVGGWAQHAYVKASNTGSGDAFGITVAISDDGNTIVAGADGEASDGTGVNSSAHADDSAGSSGAVYLFE